jgi:hypothetical protein
MCWNFKSGHDTFAYFKSRVVCDKRFNQESMHQKDLEKEGRYTEYISSVGLVDGITLGRKYVGGKALVSAVENNQIQAAKWLFAV